MRSLTVVNRSLWTGANGSSGQLDRAVAPLLAAATRSSAISSGSACPSCPVEPTPATIDGELNVRSQISALQVSRRFPPGATFGGKKASAPDRSEYRQMVQTGRA